MTLQTPAFSVLMPMRDAASFLRIAIESVQNQTFKNWELLIADNGSRDHSVKIAEDCARKDSRIRILNCSGSSLSNVRNRLLSESRADFVAWLDSDDVAEPQRLEQQKGYLEQNPDCVIVGTDVIVIDPDGDIIRYEAVQYDHDEILNQLMSLQSKGIFFPASAGRRQAILDVGGLNTKFRCAEDIDLFLRLAEKGRLANLPIALTRYRWRTDNLSWSESDDCNLGFRLAVQDARTRKGLDGIPLTPADIGRSHTMTKSGIYYVWAKAALQAGQSGTARKYAAKSIWGEPLSGQSWRCFALSLFPLANDSHRTGFSGRVRQFCVSAIRRILFMVAAVCDRIQGLRRLSHSN